MGRSSKDRQLSGHNYLPDQKEAGKALVRIVGSTPGKGQPDYIYHVCGRDHVCGAFYSSDQCRWDPDDQILDAFKDAARRGVDVKIIAPNHRFTGTSAQHGIIIPDFWKRG